MTAGRSAVSSGVAEGVGVGVGVGLGETLPVGVGFAEALGEGVGVLVQPAMDSVRASARPRARRRDFYMVVKSFLSKI